MKYDMYSFICPHCASARLNMLDYESLMVLRSDLGLFSVSCPHCHEKTSLLRPIPACLHDEVSYAAAQAGAGMGHTSAQG